MRPCPRRRTPRLWWPRRTEGKCEWRYGRPLPLPRPAERLQHGAQRIVGLGKLRRKVKGPAVAPGRLVELTGMAMGVAEVGEV